ncbi:EAL domain-containing protein [Thermocrinis sp.]
MNRRYMTLLDLYKETMIPNTVCLRDILKKIFYFHERKYKKFSLLLVDIDNLRGINKQKGYFVGNQALILVADIISKNIRKSDIAGKYKSGSFLIILPETDENGARVVLNRIESKMLDLKVEGMPLKITLGVCTYPDDGESPEDLMDVLEENVAEAKKKKEPIVHTKKLTQQYISIDTVISAIEENRVFSAFQPILNLRDNSIEGYEVLMRLKIGDKYLSASAFIGQISDLSLLTVFEEIVFDKTIRVWKTGRIKGKLFFNMPSNFVNYLAKGKAKLKDFRNEIVNAGMEPENVVIEIPESKITTTTEELIEIVGNIRSLGFRVAVDDFGVENSSVERLLKTKPDMVKVDGFFLKEERSILRWIIAGLKRLGCKVILEHVERAEELDLAIKYGADCAQGFYIGKPEVLV